MQDDEVRYTFTLPDDLIEQIREICIESNLEIGKYVRQSLYQAVALDSKNGK